jgi:hypothetical protein
MQPAVAPLGGGSRKVESRGDPDGGSFVPRLGRDALVKVVGGRHFEYRDGCDSTSQNPSDRESGFALVR